MTAPDMSKRRVTMRNTDPFMEAVDYVRVDFLDAYLAKARLRWQAVEVSAAPDFGPGGVNGATFVPADLDHPLAGQFFPASRP